ncbi:MAG: DUF4286 family protein [Acidobacteria bacterium]|nr:DUF4286 family protein [Acidobacteriota bacterium]
MLIYEITAKVRADLIGHYERYMRETHIPDLMATGFFSGAKFLRSGDGYRIQYETDDLDGYLARTPRVFGPIFRRTSPRALRSSVKTWTWSKSGPYRLG